MNRVRSRILEQNSQRQREIYFEKFLKILKVIHLSTDAEVLILFNLAFTTIE
jgi:hypothetical protein